MRLCLCIVYLFAAKHITAENDKGFISTDYKIRREKLSSQITDGVAIVVNYSGVLARTRTDPEFLYLTGVDTPGAKLVIIPKKIAILFSVFMGFLAYLHQGLMEYRCYWCLFFFVRKMVHIYVDL